MAKANVSRRSVLGAIGAGVVAVPLASTVARAGELEDSERVLSATTQDAASAATMPEAAPAMTPQAARSLAEALVAPLAPGARLARWTVVAIRPLELGAVGVAVRGEDGHAFELEVLARDASPIASRPPARTDRFAIHVLNGGDGWSPTVEDQGLAVRTLARVVAANEHSVDASAFCTHAERYARHGGDMRSGKKPSPETSR